MKSRFMVLVSVSLLWASAWAANTPVPLVSQPLVPGTVAPGNANFVLTVNGANFIPGAVVQWNGSTRVTQFISAHQLAANIQAADVSVAGTAMVRVVNPGPTRRGSNVALFPVATPRTQLSFSMNSINSSGDPNALVATDLNNDGIADLAVCKDSTGKVSVMVGTGAGQFGTATDYLITGKCSAIVAADFNGDNKMDVAAVNTGKVAVLLGRGNGRLTPAKAFAAGITPKALTVGDFNADGKLDLAVANFDSGNVSVLLGNGDGTFQPHVDYAAGDGAQGVATGDFNGDGILDLVVAAERANEVFIFLGVGDGTFLPGVSYGAGINSSYVATADLNGDGVLDLVVSDLNPLTYPISTLLGNGDGTFQTRKGAPATAYGTPALGDIDGDGILDVALIENSGPAVLLGKGNGMFKAPLFLSTQSANAVTIADFNNDGLLDLAVGGYTSNQIPILLQMNTGQSSH
jgi:hypothetical protein